MQIPKTDIRTPNTAVLILAAGNSSRLGKPKQLLDLGNTTLLQHTIEETLKLPCDLRVLVLGAYQEDIRAKLNSSNITILENRDWETGMASSIRVGLSWLVEHHDPDQVLILLCDQPFLDHKLMGSLIAQKSKGNKGIIGSAYGGTVGVPVLFDRKYFPELMALNGKEGAKKLVKKYGEDLGLVDFPEGRIDIDTETDFNAYLKGEWNYFDQKKD